MVIQLAVGTMLILASIVVAGLGFWALEVALSRLHPWLTRTPHRPKMMLLLCGSVTWLLALVTAGVWIWALALWVLDIFVSLEASVYFALVAFTTLGFGDILLPPEWRLLSGMAAINGLLNMGLLTAMMIEVMRRVRTSQLQGRTSSTLFGPDS